MGCVDFNRYLRGSADRGTIFLELKKSIEVRSGQIMSRSAAYQDMGMIGLNVSGLGVGGAGKKKDTNT
jgi:hypothetical protein